MKEKNLEASKAEFGGNSAPVKVTPQTIKSAITTDISCAISFLHLILNEPGVYRKVCEVIIEHYREKGELEEGGK